MRHSSFYLDCPAHNVFDLEEIKYFKMFARSRVTICRNEGHLQSYLNIT